MENLLISIYLTVCEIYSSTLVCEVQRFSNNFRPKFTDEEAITCYIFGILERKFTVKDTHKFIRNYWASCFPNLPTYKQFNKRITLLAPAFKSLARKLIGQQLSEEVQEIIDLLTDSLPIIVAGNNRSGRARAASELCNKGYCASKGMYFYGVRLHFFGLSRPHKMPKIYHCRIEPASDADITISKDTLQNAENINVYGDKAFADKEWHAELAKRNVRFYTPVKLKKGQVALDAADKLWSRAVSSIRQPVESFFAWLQDKTHIQFASKIRSTDGLIAFIFARIAAVLCAI